LFLPRIYLHDDALMLCGEVGKEMFIIERGKVLVTSADKSVVFATIKQGDYIGESCMLDITKRTASAYAVNYVDTFYLTNDRFLKVYIFFVVVVDSFYCIFFSYAIFWFLTILFLVFVKCC
jgi:CRP-like cAMP-binding protein